MDLPDVNILIGAHREDHPDHQGLKKWPGELVNGPSAFALAESVAASFLRIVTNPRAFADPTPLSEALAFIEAIIGAPNCVLIRAGERHFGIFTTLCRSSGGRGNLGPDAYFAALAIESGCRWATRDRDFARFRKLNWFDPLDDAADDE